MRAGFFIEFIFPEHDLDPAIEIAQIDEDHLPLAPVGEEPSRYADILVHQLLLVLPDFEEAVGPVVGIGVELKLLCKELFSFFQ